MTRNSLRAKQVLLQIVYSLHTQLRDIGLMQASLLRFDQQTLLLVDALRRCNVPEADFLQK